ncbi:N-acetylglucosaminyl-phosphatidylinositol de-N-acetylase [Diachasma alloeum]|uniref:N-acetylglucosaminyl-phosphatidylinositol de-N-acetylase n=1 Tax=Diachasma alloeum TaxID=454923 RepID=UPI0007382714|nr:N-acetylglucosaminyl-phosphatidylinositol de-N-acetylase [Diachasma alloeum]
MLDIETISQLISDQINGIGDWWWWYVKEISWQLILAPIAYVLVCIFIYQLLKRVNHRAWQLPGPPGRLLLVTAHPDDEVMFFGPMIYWLTKLRSSNVYLLCFTTGGHRRRKQELWSCAKIMGIPEGNVTILMNSELPDDPKVQWPGEIVAEHILQYIETYKINAVVTFDKHGVSGHRNHISLFYAVASLCIEKKIPSYCKLYILESVNLIRKYVQLLDLPISLLTSSYWYLVTYEQRKLIHRAMAAHKSQYVWFRKLYMLFSRYTFINTLQEVNALDLELDFQYDDD